MTAPAVAGEATALVPSRRFGVAGRGRGPKCLTLRDKQLLAVLAVARYLSTEQLQRLFFPTRLKRTCEQVLEALGGWGRLAMLRPVVKRQVIRTLEGAPLSAWTLTASGYLVAEEVLGAVLKMPAQGISLEFLEHTLNLNEVLAALLEPQRPPGAMPERGRRAAVAFARAELKRFRWTSSEGARLPWREYDAKAGRRRERVILPDAVLELVGPKRRLFLECEMGTHTIVAPAGDKPGSTIAKVERYHHFCRRQADPESEATYYDVQYPDGYVPEVLFLVRSPARARHINEALAAWRKGLSETPVAARGVTFAEACPELRKSAGLPPSGWTDGVEPRGAASSPGPGLPRGHGVDGRAGQVLSRFFAETTGTLQALRHRIRAVPPALRAQYGLSEPAYPKDTRAVSALVEELQKSIDRGSDSAGPPRPRDLAPVGGDPDLRFGREGSPARGHGSGRQPTNNRGGT